MSDRLTPLAISKTLPDYQGFGAIRMKDGLSSWCAACHNATNRRARLERRVGALLEEAAWYEREADAAPSEGRAESLRSAAANLRREAAVELASVQPAKPAIVVGSANTDVLIVASSSRKPVARASPERSLIPE